MSFEEDLHVFDRIDRDAGLADIAGHARVVGVVTAVGCQIESHREALLPGRQVGAVERVGFFGGRKTGVLANGPGTIGVHRGSRSADEGKEARHRVDLLEAFQVRRRVEGLDLQAVGARPHQLVCIATFQLLGRCLFPIVSIRHPLLLLRWPGIPEAAGSAQSLSS